MVLGCSTHSTYWNRESLKKHENKGESPFISPRIFPSLGLSFLCVDLSFSPGIISLRLEKLPFLISKTETSFNFFFIFLYHRSAGDGLHFFSFFLSEKSLPLFLKNVLTRYRILV